MALTKAERQEVKDLLELAADLAAAKSRLDPAWPSWRKKVFWDYITPKIIAYKARAKALTGFYVIL